MSVGSDEFTFNADVLFEKIKKARADFEESETDIKKARKKRDYTTHQLKKIVEELYKKGSTHVKKIAELQNQIKQLEQKLRECEGKHGK